MPIDLRSDTVTRPSKGMRQAIAAAEVDDDVLGHDPTVLQLEECIAKTLGKEAALFVPSGTMANQMSIRAHSPPGTEVILERWSHVRNFEAGASHALWGVGFVPLEGRRGFLDPQEVRAAIRPSIPHLPRTSLVWAENTHNYSGGSVWPVELLDAVADIAHEAGLPFHLDGARIWNASIACGQSPARIAARADTVSVCMSKALGSPVGSLVAGTRAFVDRCWVIRKQMGGGMRQSGILAAAGLYGLEHNLPRLAEDHANARILAENLARLDGVDVDLEATQSNIVVFDVAKTGKTPKEILDQCSGRGVLFVPFGPTRIRGVTHLDVSREDVTTAFQVVAECLGQAAHARAAS
jgi:threonine aldolase